LITCEYSDFVDTTIQHTKKMTDSSSPQAVSTQGSFSPAVQKLVALGNKEYALKNYEKAVEHYGEASELQSPSPPS